MNAGMKRLFLGTTIVAAALVLSAGGVAADIEYGEYLASECVTCHQPSGAENGIPSIVGWPEESFVAVMNSYKNRERDNPVMQTIAGRYGEEEIAAPAIYFASLQTDNR
jgi:cytochrome c